MSDNSEFGHISLQYFGALSESLGIRDEVIILPQQTMTVTELRTFLALRIGPWKSIVEDQIFCAVNKSIAQHSQTITCDDEVAFFPPVTGG